MYVFASVWDAIGRGITDHHWLTIVTGVGSFATAAGIGTGAVLAVLYGRKASVSISAEAHLTESGVVVSARPMVKAVGIFRVKFHVTEGVSVRLTEVYVENGDLKEGQFWTKGGAFGQQYVDSGEELTTTVVFSPMSPAPSVIGWLVYLKIAAPTRLTKFRTAWWADQAFVPRPGMTATVT
ncbi:MAG: hypothetical protein ABSE47_15020 [Acidimicrobiales bacterium]|jgi:hypothetical protein